MTFALILIGIGVAGWGAATLRACYGPLPKAGCVHNSLRAVVTMSTASLLAVLGGFTILAIVSVA